MKRFSWVWLLCVCCPAFGCTSTLDDELAPHESVELGDGDGSDEGSDTTGADATDDEEPADDYLDARPLEDSEGAGIAPNDDATTDVGAGAATDDGETASDVEPVAGNGALAPDGGQLSLSDAGLPELVEAGPPPPSIAAQEAGSDDETCAIDRDLDGVPECEDECPTDADKAAPGTCGCGEPDVDSDEDGLLDCEDDCPLDPHKAAAGICGCGVADVDGDVDDAIDCLEECPQDGNKTEPGLCGCGASDEGIEEEDDCEDLCPDDPDKRLPGECGCGVTDEDVDMDGTADCDDECPDDDDKTAPGICGCGESDGDADSDGTPDCDDECPSDEDKTEPGLCGCGAADLDTDGDETLDCDDECPLDDNKVAPGECGCGEADLDSDDDGALDCEDECPDDPEKVAPGICGCGVDEALCDSLVGELLHRYSFNGDDDVLVDSIGDADGTAVGAVQNGTGQLVLGGTGTDEYAELPVSTVTGLTDATFEAWVNWTGEDDVWERIFDLGRGGPVTPGTSGVDFLYFTCDGAGSLGVTAGVYLDGTEEDDATSDDALPKDTLTHAVLVFDDTGNELRIYIDGELVDTGAMSSGFDDIAAEDFRLGYSQFSDDATFEGEYEEFRVYGSALSDEAIAASFALGPNAALP